MLEFRFPEITAVLKRCAVCAGEPVPADLPERVEPTPIVPTARMASLRALAGTLPFDYKAAQSGREPGEEG